MSTQVLVFLKQLLDNAEYANETGLLNVIKLFKHGDSDVTEGTAYAPGAFATFQRLIELRPDLCTATVLRELRALTQDDNGRVRGVVQVALDRLAFSSGGGKSHTRTTPATTRTAALDGPELRRLLAESRLGNLLEKQFAPPEYERYVLTPAELCDITDSLGDEAIILWQVEKPGRLDAQSDVIVNISGKSGGIGPAIIGLYTFDSGHYAERVWTNKQILPENLSLESIMRMLNIRGRTAVNFLSGSYSYTPGEMEQVTSSQLWERLCSHCDTLGIRLS